MKSFFRKIVILILTLEARIILKKYKPQIIAVTGNIGKTGTKDAIYSVLLNHFHVRKSQKSFNSEFGVPLTILGEESGWGSFSKWFKILLRGLEMIVFSEDYPKILVLEVGADFPGEIKKTAKWVHPDITVVTQFAPIPVHIEHFKDRESLINEKGYIVKATKKSGLVLYTAEDKDSEDLARKSKSKTASFGFSEEADIKAESISNLYEITGSREVPAGISVRVTKGDKSVPLRMMGVLGNGHIYGALPAIYIADKFGINLIDSTNALSAGVKPKGRMRLLKGKNNTTIIDDTYNASPKAVEHALKTLGSLNIHGRKIAVLGDMLDLGKWSNEEHFRLGAIVHENSEFLITVGKRSKEILRGAIEAGMKEINVCNFEKSELAADFLQTFIKEEDIILIKGSQSIRMEKVTAKIILEEDRKNEFLVRQDKEWLAKK